MELPEFKGLAPARLLRARPAAAEQAHLWIEPPSGFVAAYDRPGQFCKIRVGDAEGIFAMLSAPGEREARFLVRVGNPDGGEAADLLAALADGTPIEMSLPAGRGFELELARGRPVRFVATGTGVAPVRAAIEVVLRERDAYGPLSLDYGLRSATHLAIADDIERWRSFCVDVAIHYSRVEHGAVRGETVQDALRARGASLEGAAIVAVGQPEMLDELVELAVLRGADRALFLRNV